MKWVLLTGLLVLLAACVNISEEELQPPEVLLSEEPVAEPQQEPTPLAPLPEEKEPEKMSKTTGPAVMPKSVPANSTTQAQQPQQQSVASGWTTESLSIEEGETKYVYIKDPMQP